MTIQDKLLFWYFENRRILPFRQTKDAYKIWISEVMLQQTQVETVIPYYNRFIDRFPAVTDLAKASEDEVFKLWEGLGYYSRARNLHKCAKVLVKEYSGVFPKDHKAALKLPGIGPYTAGAVLSIAYNLKYPAVDGNVMRVISRIYNIKDDTSMPKTKKVFEEKVRRIIPEDASNFNQALMELGAMICKPKSPKCDKCPLKTDCVAHELNIQAELPVKTKKIKNKKVYVAVAILKEDNRVLLLKNESGLLSGLWGLPISEGASLEEARDNLEKKMATEYGYSLIHLIEQGKAKHVFTHKTWHMTAYLVENIGGESEVLEIDCVKDGSEDYKTQQVWVEKYEIENYAVSTAIKKIIEFI